MHKLGAIRWIKAHMDEEQALKRGYIERDWEGNCQADAAAKRGAAAHGYPSEILLGVRDRSALVAKVQNHFTNTYISYLNFDKYEEAVKARRKAKTGHKGGKGTVGRPKQKPEDMGHE